MGWRWHVLDALAAGDLETAFPGGAAGRPDPPGPFTGCHGASVRRSAASYLAGLDVVFPVLHGTFGEDGTLQGLLELADLAYVGAGVLGSAVGMDKGIFKSIMRAEGIPVVDWIDRRRAAISAPISTPVIDRAMQLADFPLFIKPANLGSSVGITRCMSPSDLMEGLYEAARFDRRVLIERG